jgi:DNA-binding response OmpR family regulator
MLRRRVLVVEDDLEVQDLLLLALDNEGYEAQAIINGRAALDVLAEWLPDVILLDLQLPEMDGWTFRQRQLADPATASIPVVVLSAGTNLHQDVDMLQAQVVIPKPFSLDVVLAVVRTLTAQPEPPRLHSRN